VHVEVLVRTETSTEEHASLTSRQVAVGQEPLAVLGCVDGVVRLVVALGESRELAHDDGLVGGVATLRVEVAELMDSSFKERGVVFHLQTQGRIPPFAFDSGQIRQVLINIFKNAIEAMDYRGTLTIDVGIYNVFWALVEISDTGAGMSREARARAFEPFFTAKRRGRGTGLGLPITRRIIEDHRGSIDVISQEGRGTTFRIKIPMHT